MVLISESLTVLQSSCVLVLQVLKELEYPLLKLIHGAVGRRLSVSHRKLLSPGLLLGWFPPVREI